MRIAVLGTGDVGHSLARGLGVAGHHVVLGTRDPEVTLARDGWSEERFDLAAYDDAVVGAEVVICAVSGAGTLAALAQAGAGLDGKVLIDVGNPLDFSQGFPPTLSVKDTDSQAEQIQRAHPKARVVKTLNTVNNSVMVAPASVGDGDTTMFLAGDDGESRAVARGLLTDLGWVDVIEFDSLAAARGMEMMLPLWVQLMQSFGHAEFNVKVVRNPT